MSALDAALWLAEEHGFRVFPVDHPDLPECAGIGRGHDPSTCEDRGKHPAVAFTHRATGESDEISAMFNSTPRNVGVYCGDSHVLIVDEDKPGEFARYAESVGEEI